MNPHKYNPNKYNQLSNSGIDFKNAPISIFSYTYKQK